MEDKKKFVEGPLQELIKAIDPDVESVEFESKRVAEVVKITYVNGLKVNIDVTADSKKAMVMDVMAAVGR